MKNVIYKYRLAIGKTKVELPSGGRLLSVQSQGGEITLWVQIDMTPLVERTFVVVGTGHEFEPTESWKYLDTVQIESLVWHVFEV